MSAKEGVTLPALPVASPPANPLDDKALPSFRQSNRHSVISSSSEQVKRLQRENARLREEVESLKAMFSRKMAHDEAKFEEQIRAKDLDCERWFKSKKHDLDKMKAASSIMKAIFDARKKKFEEDMMSEQSSFSLQKLQWQEDMERVKLQLKDQEVANNNFLETSDAAWKTRLQLMEEERDSAVSDNKELQRQLSEKTEECEQRRKEQTEQSLALEQLRSRLGALERTDELLKRNTQIEALEAEIKRTKKMIHDRQQSEAEALRRELMEYVKFVMHVLPEEWQSKVKEQESMRLVGLDDVKAIVPAPAPPGNDSRGRQSRGTKGRRSQHRPSHAMYPSPYLQNGAGSQSVPL